MTHTVVYQSPPQKISGGWLVLAYIVFLLIYIGGGLVIGSASDPEELAATKAWGVSIAATLPILLLLSWKAGNVKLAGACVALWALKPIYAAFFLPILPVGDGDALVNIGRIGLHCLAISSNMWIDPSYAFSMGGNYAGVFYYFGYPLHLFGDHNAVLVPWQTSIQVLASVEAWCIADLLRLRSSAALSVGCFVLVYPEFLILTSIPARDIVVVFLILLYADAMLRFFVNGSQAAGLAVVIPIFLIGMFRDVYLLLLSLHFGVCWVIQSAGAIGIGKQTQRTNIVKLVGLLGMLLFGGWLFLHVKPNGDVGFLTRDTQAAVEKTVTSKPDQNELVATAPGVGARLSDLSTPGMAVVGLPVRLAMGVFAPFPWTRRETLEGDSGFNGSYAVLCQHVLKVLTTIVMFAGFWNTLWQLGPRLLLREPGFVFVSLLIVALLLAGCLTDTGFSRYFIGAYPLMWALGHPTVANRQATRSTRLRLVPVAVMLCVLMHVAYYVGAAV
jgi:hypothetical protein